MYRLINFILIYLTKAHTTILNYNYEKEEISNKIVVQDRSDSVKEL